MSRTEAHNPYNWNRSKRLKETKNCIIYHRYQSEYDERVEYSGYVGRKKYLLNEKNVNLSIEIRTVLGRLRILNDTFFKQTSSGSGTSYLDIMLKKG